MMRSDARGVVASLAATGLLCGAVAGLASTPTTGARPLPPDREGVVVAWRAQSNSAIVALRSGHLLSVHALRRARPGTRVRVDGVKWGTPTAGIKWGTAPLGVKWGIKWARNGTFRSGLKALRPARGVTLRGVVVRTMPGAVAIGTRGGVVVVRRAVWLPRVKSTQGATPRVGDFVRVTARFGPGGNLVGRSGRVIPTRGPVPLEMGGTFTVTSRAARTGRIVANPDPAFTVVTRMTLPGAIDLAKLPRGGEVAAAATVGADGSLRVAEIGPNDSFAAADDPSLQQSAPPAAGATARELIERLRLRWERGAAGGEIGGDALRDAGRALLAELSGAAADGDIARAADAAERLRTLVVDGYRAGLGPAITADMLTTVSALVLELKLS